MATSIQTKWGETTSKWANTQFTWGDVEIIAELEEVRRGTTSRGLYDYFREELEPKKKKRVIQLITIVKGIKTKETKEVRDDIKITAEDIEMLITEMNKILVEIKIKK